MAKVEIGDIFEVSTSKGKAYFQCVKIDKNRWDTIKVFNRLYNERPLSIEGVTKIHDSYLVGFALRAAYRRELVEKVGHMSLPDYFEFPRYMRDEHIIGREFLGWHIVDTTTWKRQFTKELSKEQKKLSPWGIWNDTLLKEMLERGWSLENWQVMYQSCC